MRLTNVDAVVFDMDGVIFDTERIILNMWVEAAKIYNLENIEEVVRRCIGCNAQMTEDIFKAYYGEDVDYTKIKQGISEKFHGKYDGGRLPKKDYVDDILKYLKNKGYKIALATSTRQAVVIPEIKDAGLYDYFDEIICGDMVSQSKPNPEIFLKAAKSLKVPVERIVGIEDSYNGIRALSAAGMIPIMVPDILEPDDEMLDKAAAVVDSLKNIEEYL